MSDRSHAGLRLALLLATGLAAAVASGETHAYTYEEQQACMPDAFRLCGSEIPDVGRITACMIRNRSQLSPQCRAHFHGGPEPREEASEGRPVRPAAAERLRMHRIRKARPDAT
jgi:hypothetical protein